MNDKIYNELCDIVKRGPGRKPIDVIHSFVDSHIINVFEIHAYLERYNNDREVRK